MLLLPRSYLPLVLFSECWFSDQPTESKHSFVQRFFLSTYIPRNHIFLREKHTLHIHLSSWSPSLVTKKFQYDIKQCSLYPLTFRAFTFSSDPSSSFALYKSYFQFAKVRNLQKPNLGRLLSQPESFICTSLVYGDHMSNHIYITDSKRARLLYSWTLFPDNAVSKVKSGLNKTHTLRSIEYFRDAGFLIYDFGGYNPKRSNGIDIFKSRFGGSLVLEYNYFVLNF